MVLQRIEIWFSIYSKHFNLSLGQLLKGKNTTVHTPLDLSIPLSSREKWHKYSTFPWHILWMMPIFLSVLAGKNKTNMPISSQKDSSHQYWSLYLLQCTVFIEHCVKRCKLLCLPTLTIRCTVYVCIRQAKLCHWRWDLADHIIMSAHHLTYPLHAVTHIIYISWHKKALTLPCWQMCAGFIHNPHSLLKCHGIYVLSIYWQHCRHEHNSYDCNRGNFEYLRWSIP